MQNDRSERTMAKNEPPIEQKKVMILFRSRNFILDLIRDMNEIFITRIKTERIQDVLQVMQPKILKEISLLGKELNHISGVAWPGTRKRLIKNIRNELEVLYYNIEELLHLKNDKTLDYSYLSSVQCRVFLDILKRLNRKIEKKIGIETPALAEL